MLASLQFYNTKPHASLCTSDVCRGSMLQLAEFPHVQNCGNAFSKESLSFANLLLDDRFSSSSKLFYTLRSLHKQEHYIYIIDCLFVIIGRE